MEKNSRIELMMFGLLVALVFLAGCQSPQYETINVMGHSEMTVAPDRAKVYAGISILKPTAAEAQAEADRVINKIIDGLRYEGIAEGDIETENLNLYEETEWVQEYKLEYPSPEPAKMVSKGWRATQTLKIKTTDLSKVGDIVDIAVSNGANQINSIEFYLSSTKDEESKQQVLADATKNAKSKAQAMADSLGVKLGKIVSASESNYGYMPYRYAMANNAGVAAVSESATIMPSDVSVSADMSLVYQISQ